MLRQILIQRLIRSLRRSQRRLLLNLRVQLVLPNLFHILNPRRGPPRRNRLKGRHRIQLHRNRLKSQHLILKSHRQNTVLKFKKVRFSERYSRHIKCGVARKSGLQCDFDPVLQNADLRMPASPIVIDALRDNRASGYLESWQMSYGSGMEICRCE